MIEQIETINMQIDSTRIDAELAKMKKDALDAEEFRNKAVEAANRYIERLMPIIKKRGIKIASSQMYFNSIDDKHNHALAILTYAECLGEYNGVKAKRLQKELYAAGIPMPIGNVNRYITITLYDETLNR